MDRQGVARVAMRLATVGLVGSLLGGCVSQQEYDSLYESNRSLTSRNTEMSDQLAAANARVESLEGTNSGAEGTIGQIRSDNQRLRQQLGSANEMIMAMEDRLGNMEFGRVDPKTDLALQRFAEAHPGIVAYEADKGMLRFSSDLTFGSGSDVVASSASQTLASFANVLKLPEAQQYDVKIVGHTDAEKVSTATQERGHRTNMHLSAHRAIAVRNVLGKQGVAWERMYAAGWGENRPAVANTANGDTPANRRVEIFLVPSTVTAFAPTTTNATADDENAPTRAFEPTK